MLASKITFIFVANNTRMTFKYQEQLDKLLSEGYTMPHLHEPNGMNGYRYVFVNGSDNNHKPVCIQNPSRRLPNNEKFSGYALSCFDSQQNAEKRYAALCKSFKRTPKTIGDALSGGQLENQDGLVTTPDKISGHFDLYEYASCDLNKIFKIIETLWKS